MTVGFLSVFLFLKKLLNGRVLDVGKKVCCPKCGGSPSVRQPFDLGLKMMFNLEVYARSVLGK